MERRAELEAILAPERVLTRYLDRIAFANDASVYRLVPAAVVLPRSVDEIRALFRFSHQHNLPLTFRTAGTSLSGQAVTDGVLVEVARHWRSLEVLDDGGRVRVQPGVIGGTVNAHLRPHGRQLGPDPASINACMMGGILSNNSSGMCCGVVNNAYHTLDSIHFLLPQGLELDTADAGAHAKLEVDAPELFHGLAELKREVEGRTALRERIRSKYRMKNTTGYSLNAFLDFDHPLDMLAHLLIGSEGTLAFIAEAVLRTVPDYPLKSTGLLLFPDVPSACAAIAPLRESGARALELMDRASLRSIESQPGVPAGVRELPPDAAALLTEYQVETEEELERARRGCEAALPRLPLLDRPEFTRDADRQAALWSVRKGLIPSVGAMRRRGTSFIIEDVVFPVERLAAGVTDLQGLFVRHGYDDAIVFGHAKDGNLHFVLTQAFDVTADVERYDTFMRELAEVVVDRHGGALKAEHGTGRNMAPFVEAEWGGEALEIMRRLKRLIDPHELLNPGVILNDDPMAHVAHLKDLPQVEPEVDHCIECGFCERVCPSRDLTLTPRQRIVVRREMARLRSVDPGSALLRELESDYGYTAIETCAADGLCAMACPVAIDTGALIKRLRGEAHTRLGQKLASLAAGRLGLVERTARSALRAAGWVRGVAGDGADRRKGSWPWLARELPRAAAALPRGAARAEAAAVLFPSCVSRVMAGGDGNGPTMSAVRVARRAELPLWTAPAAGVCCGMPFSSKGFDAAFRRSVNRAVAALWEWSHHGTRPIVVDSSPCTWTLRTAVEALTPANRERHSRLEILDGVEYAHDRLLPRLDPVRRAGAVALHPVCSVQKMGLGPRLVALGEACSEAARVPLTGGCCGFAGDRGFTHPELTESATRAEAAELAAASWSGCYSSSRTCELGLTRATGLAWQSFWNLLEASTVAAR